MERLNSLEPLWVERDRLNILSNTELMQCLVDAHIDMMENPLRAFETYGTATIAAQLLASRKVDFYEL